MKDPLKYNFKQTCRACLTQNVKLTDLHTYQFYVGLNSVTQFEFCTKIKVFKNDNLPSNICVDCVEKLNAAYLFIQLCQVSDAVLRKIDWSVPYNNKVELECLSKNIQTEYLGEHIDTLNYTNREKTLTRKSQKWWGYILSTDTFGPARDRTSETSYQRDFVPERFRTSEISARRDASTRNQCLKSNKCHICSKSYRTTGHLKLHLKLHSSDANDGYLCNMCSKKFTQKGALTNHMKRHRGLKQSDYLDQPKREFSSISDHTCRVCYKTFETQGMVNVHLKNGHTKRERLKCQLCKQIFKTRSSLLKHLKRHMGDKKNGRFDVTKWMSFIDGHNTNMTNINAEKIDTENSKVSEKNSDICHVKNKLYNCSKCNKSFTHRSSLSFHLRKHKADNNNGFYCKICNRRFKLMVYLKHHEKIHNEDKMYSCQTCLKKFHRKSSLNRHVLNHRLLKESQFLCYTCGFLAKNYSTLKLHMAKHSDVFPYTCNVCQKKFQTKGSLLSHEKVHTGVKKYNCSLCAKRYVNSSGLRYHMRSHDVQKTIKIRLYQCRECDKAFETEKDLYIHIVIHSGDFPHRCEICKRGFNRFGNYKRHLQRHSGVKSFICDICGFAVFSASALKIHCRVHTGEKPYLCDSCKRKFATSGGLLRHKKRLHANLKKNNNAGLNKDISNLVNNNVNTGDVQENTQKNISEYNVILDTSV